MTMRARPAYSSAASTTLPFLEPFMRGSVRTLLLISVLWTALTSSALGQTSDYRKLVDDYRRYGASAAPKAAALTDDQIAEGRHAVAGSWEELRAAAMLHTEAMILLASDGQLPSSTRHLDAAVALLDDVVKASPPQRPRAVSGSSSRAHRSSRRRSRRS